MSIAAGGKGKAIRSGRAKRGSSAPEEAGQQPGTAVNRLSMRDRYEKAVAEERAFPEPSVDERVVRVEVARGDDGEGHVTFHLADGRVVQMPLSWSWRLQLATDEELHDFQIVGAGHVVHWPGVDEDLSGRGALRGTPAPRPGSRTSAPETTRTAWTPGAIKQLRQRLGDTQAQFADRVAVRQATISDWENGNLEPSPMACRLLDILAATAPDSRS